MKKFAKKTLAGALTFALVLGMASVATPDTAEAKKVKVKKVTVTSPSGKTVYVAKRKKVKLTATVKVTPNKKANKKVTYKSANKKVATVNSKGYVKGVKVGSTKITVKSKKNSKKKATIKVVVKKAAVKKVKLNKKKATVAVGGKLKLKATVSPSKNVSKKIQWISSKKKVATVSSSGMVKGKSEGTTKITAKAADGSGKKATCTVTVGAGIQNIEVPNSSTVRVTLTSAKALTAANFKVQNKKTQAGKYNTTEGVEKVRTTDNKTYEVVLDHESYIQSHSWLKVTVDALKVDNSKEIQVGNVPSLDYAGTETIERVTDDGEGYEVGDTYSDYWSVREMDTVGDVTYTVTGLPAGFKAYMDKNATSVSVKGKFTQVLDGTTAVLTGTDEAGNVFKKNYVFYVGDKSTIVANYIDETVLTRVQDNPLTLDVDEESGYCFDNANINSLGEAVISGGSGSYRYEMSGLPANVTQEMDTVTVQEAIENESGDITTPAQTKEIGTSSLNHAYVGNSYAATTAGVYPISVTIIDRNNEAVRKTVTFNLTLSAGTSLSGKVTDAAGQGAQTMGVEFYTKRDAYGNYDEYYAYTEKDGSYTARVIPGEYTSCVYKGGYQYDKSNGNAFTAATAVKDFTVPLYRINFTTNIAGAAAYDVDYYPYVYDTTGHSYAICVDDDDSRNRTYGLYAYLPTGNYEFSPAASKYSNEVFAYSKVMVEPETYNGAPTGHTYSWLSSKDMLAGPNFDSYQLSGTFNVAGSATVGLTATPIVYEN